MTTCIIFCIICFVLGFITCALNFKFWLKHKKLTEEQVRKITTIIQDKYLRTEEKIKKILEIIKS